MFSIPTRHLLHLVLITRRVFYQTQEILALREQLGSLPFVVGSMLLIFVVFTIVFFFVFILCLMSHVSCVIGLSILDCPLGFLQHLFRDSCLPDIVLSD
jgi:hypothetical protein